MIETNIIRNLINEKGYNLKEFSKKINLPYTTLHSILKRGIGNASVDNVIKICKGLEIKFEELEKMSKEKTDFDKKIILSDKEKEIIKLFRELSDEDKMKAKWKFEGMVEMLQEQAASKRGSNGKAI